MLHSAIVAGTPVRVEGSRPVASSPPVAVEEAPKEKKSNSTVIFVAVGVGVAFLVVAIGGVALLLRSKGSDRPLKRQESRDEGVAASFTQTAFPFLPGEFLPRPNYPSRLPNRNIRLA